MDVEANIQTVYFNSTNVQIEKIINFLNNYETLSVNFWQRIENLMINVQQEDSTSVDKEEKIVGCFTSLFKTLDLSKFVHFASLISKLMKKLLLNYEQGGQHGTHIKYLSNISMIFMNENLTKIAVTGSLVVGYSNFITGS